MKKRILKIFFFSIVACLFLTGPAYAKEGDLYKEYKDEFEKNAMSKNNLETIKKYDYEEDKFNCGITEIDCHLTAAYYKIGIGIANFTSEMMKGIVVNPETIMKSKGFQYYKNGLGTLSWSMLALFLMWQAVAIVARRYSDWDDGYQAYNDKLLMTLVCGCFLGLYEPIFSWLLDIENIVVSLIVDDALSRKELIKMVFMYGANYGFVVCLIVALVWLGFGLVLMYRFILFGILYVLGVVAIPTGVNDEFNYFKIWLRHLVNNLVTLFCQVITFALAMKAMTGSLLPDNNGITDTVFSLVTGICFLIFMLVIPSLLGNLGASTGTSRALMRVTRYAITKR